MIVSVPSLVTQTVFIEIPSWVIFWAIGGAISSIVAFIVLRYFDHGKIQWCFVGAGVMFIAWFPLIFLWIMTTESDYFREKKENGRLRDKISLMELEKSNTQHKKR